MGQEFTYYNWITNLKPSCLLAQILSQDGLIAVRFLYQSVNFKQNWYQFNSKGDRAKFELVYNRTFQGFRFSILILAIIFN